MLSLSLALTYGQERIRAGFMEKTGAGHNVREARLRRVPCAWTADPLLQTYQKRWFVLDRKALRYYADEDVSAACYVRVRDFVLLMLVQEKKCLGDIKIADVEKVAPVPSSAYFEVCVWCVIAVPKKKKMPNCPHPIVPCARGVSVRVTHPAAGDYPGPHVQDQGALLWRRRTVDGGNQS